MKNFLSIINLIFVTFLLISCTENHTDIYKKDASSTELQNVQLNDSNTKPHTLQLYNDIFSIKVDDAFNGMYDTVIEKNYIELYDVESRNNGFDGLLFAICAYENPDEWAGAPCEKVGELKLQNNKLYDIVIGYPTESQFGYDSTMPENYKKLYEARYNIVKTVTGKNNEIIKTDSGIKGDDLYDEVIETLLKGINENWDANRFEDENMSPVYKSIKDNNDNYLDVIKYAYHDTNLDGIEELLIGEIDENDKFVIYDLYTMVDRKVSHVISGWFRNRYYCINNSFITNEYSNSAFESGLNVYSLETNSTNLIFQLAVKHDSSEDEKEPWYISYIKNNDEYDWDKISEEEYNSMLSRFDSNTKFEYNSLKNYQ